MLHRSFKPAKCKTSLKLATSRIKLMKNKKGVQINQMKRDLSQLLETGQERTARIRVEHVIREEKMVAAYDLIEIYCELIAARLPIIESQKNCPIDLKEAVTSVIFASPRCSDIPELQDVRKHFTAKYGKEFISTAIELRPDCGVGRMLIEKLSAVAPDVQTKIKVLTAVAEEYNIKWDPTSFEEKESKPPNDLLNGPNTFEKAGMLHSDPPKFSAAPSVQVPHYHEQRRDEPANFSQQNSRSSHGTQYFDSTDTGGNQSYADSRPSGRGAERTEFRQSFSRHGDDSSSGRQNWNMEFKDATAAAQAAAESAERASMAARAAAELSRQGKNSRQYSTDSHNSNFTEEGPRRYGEQYSRNSVNNSFSERKPQVQNQQRDKSDHASSEKAADRFYEDDNTNNRRSSRAASLKSRKDSIDDASSMNTLQKANHSQGSVKVENTTVSPEMSVRGQSRREPEGDLGKSQQDGFNSYRDEMPENRSSTSSSRSHSINFDDEDVVPRPDSWKFGNDTVEDPRAKIDHRNMNKETAETSTYDDGSDGVAFDEADSGDDGPMFDMGPNFDETDANSFFPSPGRESPIHSLEHTNSWSSRSMSKSVEKSGFQTQNFSERQTSPASPEFSEYSADPIYPSEPDNQVPTVYNPSNGPDFDNDDEHSTRQSHTSYYDLDHSQLNDQGPKSDVKSPKISNSGKSRFELTDLLEAESSLPSPLEEEKSLQSQHSTRLSHRGKLEDDVQTPQSSYSESGQELNFGPLTGGLRNKGYLRPPYIRSPSGDASSLPQKLPEVGPAYVEQMSTPIVKSSLNSVARRMEHKESSIPHTSSASDSNSSKPTPEYSRKTREEITKSRFEPPAGFLYHEDDDSEDDIPQLSSTSRVQLGAGLSRRTKATPSSETRTSSKVRVEPDGKTINSVNDSGRKPTGHSYSDQTPTEHRSYSGSFKQETSKTMHESRPARHEENLKSQAAENPSISLKKRVESSENAKASSSGGGTLTGESPVQKASHVHPKLPDYDDIAARLQALRMNR